MMVARRGLKPARASRLDCANVRGEVAWRVKVGDLKKGFDLDVKNPNSTVEEHDHTTGALLLQLAKRQQKISQLVTQLELALKAN